MANGSFSRPHSFNQFLKQWMSRHWQSVTVALLGVLIPLQAFLILALVIWRHQGGLQWDIAILNGVHGMASPQLDAFAKVLTNFGTAWGVFPAVGLIALSLLFYRRWRSLTYVLITTIGCGMINTSAKAFLHRDRPSLWEHSSIHGFSFPSGHAMSSMVLVVALTVLAWKTRWRGLAIGLGSLFVTAIGWTRLYLGVHYPSDILAGWMLTLAWAISVSLIVRPNFQPPNLLEINALENQEESVPADELIPD
ncbi:MAG: phosphatase PAP2 family protein [Drouetiella hepatica Uher 2000/2452]|jgi:undecaprenyl-diphosphatase|uniref:Phosphatase PAP2 family protein n=1 Tax=Drouetiella hepatica Uher 2000/2452 TaxID=904376 RepID=A0A951Q9U6_9CYAN|nr:phosphatase PAP2 family protein [Drouetiella hepatica Uher 2000/2452]